MKKTLALLSVFLILFPSFSEAFFAYADAELSEVTIADGTGVSGVTSGIAENTTVESDQVNTGDVANASTDNSVENIPSQNQTIDEVIPEQAANIDAVSAQTTSTSSPLPSQQTQYKLQTQIDARSGALLFDYPLDLPPGRNDHTPNISLSYNSQNKDQETQLGYGWTLAGIPEITRVNRTGVDQFYGQDISNWMLSSSLSGELVYVGNNTFKSKSDDGDFLTYQYNSSSQSFTVTDKSGTKYTFGSDSGSRQDDPNNYSNIYKWLVTTIEDANGLPIYFQYSKSQGQIYPVLIQYGDIYSVQFVTSSRNDPMTSYKTGFRVRTDQRITSIAVQLLGESKKIYTLSYLAGDNGVRSLLSYIQLTVYDAGGNQKDFPATSFDYTKSEAPLWTTSYLSLPPNTNLNNGQSIPVDFNGDGYTDILTAYQDYNGSIYKYAYINKGDGTWTYSASYLPPEFFTTSSSGTTIPTGYTAFDINGDLLPDLVQSFKLRSNQPIKNVYLNTGTGWSYSNAYSAPVIFIWNNYGTIMNLLTMADLNGDGLADLSGAAGYEQAGVYGGTYFNNSGRTSGFRAATNPWAVFPNSTDTQNKYVDLNGDGIEDELGDSVYTNGSSCYYDTNRADISDGKNSFIPSYSYASPHSHCSYMGGNIFNDKNDWGGRTFDINSDGLQDLVYAANFNGGSQDHFTYLNTGDGWSANKSSYSLPPYIQFSSYDGTVGGLIDLNGDGVNEIYSYNTIFNNDNARYADVLSTITYSTGGYSNIEYKPSTEYRDASDNLLNPKLPIIVQTASRIRTTDPVRNVTSTTTYTYADGKFFYDASRLSDKKYAGFGKVSQRDTVGNVTVSYFHTGSGTNAAYGAYDDSIGAKIGKMYRQEKYGPDGKIYTADIYRWDAANLGDNWFVYIASQLQQDINGQSGHKDTAVSFDYNISNGNLISKINYGRVFGYSDGTFTDLSSSGDYSGASDSVITSYSYASDSSAKKFQTSSELVIDAYSGSKIGETRYYYDNLSLGQLTKGNLTKQEFWKTGSTYVSAQKSYNSAGLVTSTTDERGNTTSYGYDSRQYYPVTITNPLNHITSYTYDYVVGKPSRIQDSNGFVTETDYDGIGRPIMERTSNRLDTSAVQARTYYTYTDWQGVVSVTKNLFTSSGNTMDTYTYYDGLDRIIQTKTEFGDNNSFKTQDTVYDTTGQIQRVSLPYWTSGSSRSDPTSDWTLFTSFTYDPLYRQLTSTNTLGTSEFQYTNWQTTSIDQNGNRKDIIYNAYDELVQVNEYNNDGIYPTNYAYDLSGNITKITDALGNFRSFTYDSLNRRTTATDLHAPSDSTYGVYTYGYDAAGNLTEKVDPNGLTTKYTYDALSRQLTESAVPSGSSVATLMASFSYDTCGKGFLCTVNQYDTTGTLTGTNTITYFSDGLVKSEAKKILTKTYNTSYTYDLLGNMLTITQPNGDIVSTGYDNQARFKTATLNTSPIVTSLFYSLNDAISMMNFANNVVQINEYDTSKQHRLTRKYAINGLTGVRIQDLNYTYDSIGNITKLVDVSQTATAKTLDYTYDKLSRLLSAAASGTANGQDYTQMFTYDATGNIITNSQQGVYSYNSVDVQNQYANPHAVTGIDTGNGNNFGFSLYGASAGDKAVSSESLETTQVKKLTPRAVEKFPDSDLGMYSGPVLTADWIPAVSTEEPLDSQGALEVQVDYGQDQLNPEPIKVENPLITDTLSSIENVSEVIVPDTPENTEASNEENPTEETVIDEMISIPDESAEIPVETPIMESSEINNEVPEEVQSSFSLLSPLRIFADLISQIFLPQVSYAAATVPTPIITPKGGTYTSVQTVSISNALEGTAIYYTTNGATPTTLSNLYTGPITLSANTTIKAIATKTGYTKSTIATSTFTITLPAAPTPNVSPSAGSYVGLQTVSISSALSGAQIYYTTNGTTPTTASALYTGPFTLLASATVKAIAIKSGYRSSAATSNAYTITLPTVPVPTITPAAGSYVGTQTISISDTLPDVAIYYTTNGTAPTTASTLYTGPFNLSVTSTVKAIAVKYGYNNSAAASKVFTITLPTVPAPTMSLPGGSYSGVQTISISNALQDAQIYYTTNGTTPTTASAPYTGPIALVATTTVKAIAVRAGYKNSVVSSVAYTITLPALATPTMSHTTGSYVGFQNVSITHATPGVNIYYTTNGTVPTAASTLYTGPINLTASATVKAIAIKTGYINSPVATSTLTITIQTVPTPLILPTTGTYTSIQNVSISNSLPNTQIYYTTNGTVPTAASMLYTGPLTISATTTIKAIAFRVGYKNSLVATSTLTINIPVLTAPTISLPTGTYNGDQTVTLGNATPGVTLYYTTDGTTPTTASNLYTTPLTISSSGTIKALAVKNGYINSAITSATYTIIRAPIITALSALPDTIVDGNSTTLSWTLSGGNATTISIDKSVGSVLGVSSKNVSPTVTTTYTLTASNTAGTATRQVTVTVHPKAPTIASLTASPSTIIVGDTVSLGWILGGGIPSSLTIDNNVGTVTGTLARTVSPLITTTYTLTATNITGSASKTVTVVVNLPTAPAPTISPTSGSYAGDQSITLSSTLPGVSLYYTLDGTTPTTSSTLYTAPFTLSASATIKAIAVKNGYQNSSVTTNSYTITPLVPTPVIDPAGGNYSENVIVTIVDILPGASIYYTLDGSTPTPSSTLYTGNFTLLNSATVKAIAIKSGYTASSIASSAYTIQKTKTNLTYDANGNLVKESGRRNAVYTFDYNNRLDSVTVTNDDNTTTTSSYLYDVSDQRVYEKVVTKSGTTAISTRETYYPSTGYSEAFDSTGQLAKRSIHISANGVMVSTIEYTPVTAGSQTLTQKIFYHLSDHLASTQITTDSTGTIVELSDYYAFGNPRQDIKSTPFTEQRKYIGQMYDESTSLNYLNARYYNSNIGRFISQDPVFWELGQTGRGTYALTDPQSMNSYSYAQNNPIRYSDPSGEFIQALVAVVGLALFAFGYGTMIYTMATTDLSQPISPKTISNIQVANASINLGASVGMSSARVPPFTSAKNNASPSTSNKVTQSTSKNVNPNIDPTAKVTSKKASSTAGTYRPSRALPKDKYGRPMPDSNSSHTQLGTRNGSKGPYTQALEWGFDERGIFTYLRRIDFTDHGRSRDGRHMNPHMRESRANPTGGTREWSENKPFNTSR